MVKPQPILRPLHACGPNCEILNQVGKDLANLRELVPKLEALHKEDPSNELWQRRHAEAASMLVDYEVRNAAMVKVREKALHPFRHLRPAVDAANLGKEDPRPELDDRFQVLIDELEDLVFELTVTDSDEEQKRTELLVQVDSLCAKIQVMANDLGLDKTNRELRKAVVQMAKESVQGAKNP